MVCFENNLFQIDWMLAVTMILNYLTNNYKEHDDYQWPVDNAMPNYS